MVILCKTYNMEIKQTTLSLLFALILMPGLCIAQQNVTEANANTVEIKFYRLQVSKWNSGVMESNFHALLALQANTYCEANLASCGLNSLASNFKDAHIGKVANSPIDDDKDMLYEFYIEYPAGSNISSASTLQYVLSKATVKNIVLQLRENVDYVSALGCDKCYITYIDDDFYGIPPSSLENKIIIPIAFLVLLIIIIVAIALHVWNKRQEKERKFEKLNQLKPKKQPEYVMSADAPKTTALPDDKMPEKNSRSNTEKSIWKEKMYGGSNTTPKKQFDRSGGASNDSGLDVDTSDHKVLTKHQALEPLDQDQKEKKKKKKEKKRSKRSTKVDGLENQGYMAEDEGYEKHEMKTEL